MKKFLTHRPFKSFTLSIATLPSLLLFSGEAFAQKVYWNPEINGLEIDRCINSYQYPDSCSRGATEHAAHEFCKYHGYDRATQWQWQDQSMDFQRSVYKLLEEPGNTYFRVVQGSYIFTGISCDETTQPQPQPNEQNNSRSTSLGERILEEVFDQIF